MRGLKFVVKLFYKYIFFRVMNFLSFSLRNKNISFVFFVNKSD